MASKIRLLSEQDPFAVSQGPLIASITEHTEFTGGGVVCVIFLILSACGMFLGYAGAKNAIQEIDVAVGGMASIILFGIGAIIGRRRRYLVRREIGAVDSQASTVA